MEAGQVLVGLDGGACVAAVEETAQLASSRERELMESQLLVGIKPATASRRYDDDQDSNATAAAAAPPQDWLVRQVIGLVPSIRKRMDWATRMTGVERPNGGPSGLAVGAQVREGDRLLFHVRDAHAAQSDLKLQVDRYAMERAFAGGAPAVGTPRAALMFQCVGRGAALHGATSTFRDSAMYADAFASDLPLAGCFLNGEIGPIGSIVGGAATADAYRRKTHEHEYTSVTAVICSTDDDDDAERPTPPS